MSKENYQAIDLFSGAGGLSLGFEKTGFSICCAIEKDSWASDTYKNNRNGTTKIICDDITKISDTFIKDFKNIDVVMGGPPCQGFSISASNRRDPNDPRNFLYREFVRFVKIAKPRVILVENVKEILKSRLPDRHKLIDDFRNRLSEIGYNTSFCLINAAEYGVPQNRVRFFMFGVKGMEPNLTKLREYASFGFEEPLFKIQKPKISLWEAISDLPSVIPRQHIEDDVLDYTTKPKNDFQMQMRLNSQKLHNHIPMRHTDRIIERFKEIPIGGNQNNVSEDNGCRLRGNPKKMSGKIFHQNHRRLNPDTPSPTITASFYSSFVHPYEHRNLTVREAARIQSFPDNYKFYGKRTTLSKKLLAKKGIFEDLHLDQFNQVGNSVPPMLAEKISIFIRDHLLK